MTMYIVTFCMYVRIKKKTQERVLLNFVKFQQWPSRVSIAIIAHSCSHDRVDGL